VVNLERNIVDRLSEEWRECSLFCFTPEEEHPYVGKVFVHDSGNSVNSRMSGADCASKANSEKTASGGCHETALIGMTLA